MAQTCSPFTLLRTRSCTAEGLTSLQEEPLLKFNVERVYELNKTPSSDVDVSSKAGSNAYPFRLRGIAVSIHALDVDNLQMH